MLYYLIYQNIDVKGLQIGTEEIKLSQFADNTTLILDGSQRSLEAALNTIEIFGTYSGLKMNTTKTKVIWIGDKKHSSEKLPVSYKLEWGTDRFNLLGVLFSVDLEDIPALTYSLYLEKSKKIIDIWKRRSLTPLGQITIIKTFILSQFNYLFASIPSPSDEFIKKLNELLFNYLWNGKPDKIKRLCVTQDYNNFGLRMVNVMNHISATKLMWMDRILKKKSTQICNIVEHSISNLSCFCNFGLSWLKNLIKNTHNQFWQEVFLCWQMLIQKKSISNRSEILASVIWHNPDTSDTPLFFLNWYKHGITYVADILGSNGSILSQHELEQKYALKINFLHYHKIKILIGILLKKYQEIKGDFTKLTRPCMPTQLVFIFTNQYGMKGIYNILNKTNLDLTFKNEWHLELDLTFNNNTWQKFFRICWKNYKDPFHKWFQYRILYRILGTQKLLHKIGISNSPLCLSCFSEVESLHHLFYDCPNVKNLWKELQTKILNSTGFLVNLSPTDILLGYTVCNNNSNAINQIILVTKIYIYNASKKSCELRIKDVLN